MDIDWPEQTWSIEADKGEVGGEGAIRLRIEVFLMGFESCC